MNYIVSGPGRVGGHLLVSIIQSSGQTAVYHSHDPAWTLGNDPDTTLIVLDRRDRFAAVMSNAIAQHTGQTTEYAHSTVQPFELNPGIFRWGYVKHIDHYRGYDLSRPYAAVHKIYFEDFVNNASYVKTLLNLSHTDSAVRSRPAPYHYRDIVTNWEKLRRLFDLLEAGNND